MATIVGNGLANVIIGTPSADTLLGLGGNDTLTGFGNNDFLDGGSGADTMIGGAGNDTYRVDTSADVINESAVQGIDRVVSSVSFRLDIGARVNVENLALVGTAATGIGNALNNTITGDGVANSLFGLAGNDRLFGFGGDDFLFGGSGSDWLNGGVGADTMRGGPGNDTYIVDNAGDLVIENAGAGIDRIISSINTSLNVTGRLAVENLILTGAALQGVGNALGNVITGNAAANTLAGLDGNDRLVGGAGDDFLGGGIGNDTIITGTGSDTILFNSPLVPANVDHIQDFAPGSDTIRLLNNVFVGLPQGTLHANAFHEGTAAGDATDRIIYDKTTGTLFFDADGSNSTVAQVEFATVTPGLVLTRGNFFVTHADLVV